MDWMTLLESQQTDFIQRLKSGHLLHCDIEGQHSELTVISGDKLTDLRKFCWDMVEKYKRNSQAHHVFLNNLKGKLAEEVVKARIVDLVNEVDYEKRFGGDGKVDFTLTSSPDIGIQVKLRQVKPGNVDRVRWSISSEEIEKNAVLVCILSQEEVSEAQTGYNLVLAGFKPTDNLKINNHKPIQLGIRDLLYAGGLRSYLEQLKNLGLDVVTINRLKAQVWKCLPTLSGHGYQVCCVSFSPDNQTLASGGTDHTSKIWDIKSQTLRCKFKRYIKDRSDTDIYSIAFSPTGKSIFIGGWASYKQTNAIQFFNLENQTLDNFFVEHIGNIYSVVISPDWILASGGSDGKVKVCDLRKKELIHNLDKHTKAVYSIAISSDSKTIASGSDDKTIKIWVLKTGELIRTLSGHLNPVKSVAISSDNYILVSSSCESVKIWDLKTGQLLHTLNENSSMVRCIAISPDGKIVASAGEDNTIKLWYTKTGELLHTLIGHSHQEGIDSIAFSPNGQMLASGNGDNTVEIWRRG